MRLDVLIGTLAVFCAGWGGAESLELFLAKHRFAACIVTMLTVLLLTFGIVLLRTA